MPAPIKGMTKVPDLMAVDGGAAFVGCVQWALTEPKMRAQFEAATGKSIEFFVKRRSGFETLIDQQTGREAETIAAFADWVATDIWGEEGVEQGRDT